MNCPCIHSTSPNQARYRHYFPTTFFFFLPLFLFQLRRATSLIGSARTPPICINARDPSITDWLAPLYTVEYLEWCELCIHTFKYFRMEAGPHLMPFLHECKPLYICGSQNHWILPVKHLEYRVAQSTNFGWMCELLDLRR